MSFDVVNGKLVFSVEKKGLCGLSILWATPILEAGVENYPIYLIKEEIACFKSQS